MPFFLHILPSSLLKFSSLALILKHNKHFTVCLIIPTSGDSFISFWLLLVLTHIVYLIIFLSLLNSSFESFIYRNTLRTRLILSSSQRIFIWFCQVPVGNRIPYSMFKFCLANHKRSQAADLEKSVCLPVHPHSVGIAL